MKNTGKRALLGSVGYQDRK